MSPDNTSSPDASSLHWVFGYGSLIYKVDFPFVQCAHASITGWARRFWQGSHDHRGTPSAPGRVVTLIPQARARCRGVAYQVEPQVFEHLDFREKNGYQRRSLPIRLEPCGAQVSGTAYVADTANHAFLGDAPLVEMARHILRCAGPSGSNRDYLLQLADALRMIGEEDEHVLELAAAVLEQSMGEEC